MRRLAIAWLCAGCGGAAAPTPVATTQAAEPAPAVDCERICREMQAAPEPSGALPRSPCGPGKGRVDGTVLSAGGQPVTGAFVAAHSSCGVYYATTVDDGTFALLDLPAGPYLVGVRAGSAHAERETQVAAGATGQLELRLPEPPAASPCDCR